MKQSSQVAPTVLEPGVHVVPPEMIVGAPSDAVGLLHVGPNGARIAGVWVAREHADDELIEIARQWFAKRTATAVPSGAHHLNLLP